MGPSHTMSMATAKQQTYEQFAEVARVLGNAHRLELLELIAQGERPVERLAELAHLSVANTSQHLQHMRRAGLVQSRRDGKRVLYRLAGGPVLDVVQALQHLAEHNVAEVQAIIQAYYHERDGLEAVSREELLTRLITMGVTVLDVRPEDEFRLGHIPGAINIPLAELEARLAEIPRDQEIVAYCRGAYCVLSFEAVAFLRERGYRVRRFEGGLPDWRLAGLQVTT